MSNHKRCENTDQNPAESTNDPIVGSLSFVAYFEN